MTSTLAQRAINILKSAGPGAWYDPSDIASYTAPVGPELEPALNFATWDSGGNVSTLTASSFTTTAAGGLYKAVASWSAAKYHRVRIAGTSTVAWNLRNTESGTGMVSVPAGPFNLNVVADFLKASTLGQMYIQPTGAGTVSVSSYSVVELTGLSACTMFQDSAGTTPVTAVEQPVGLILDKSQGLVLGSELVTNGDFSSATGWTAGVGWSISGGVATKVAGTGDNLSTACQNFAGKYVSITLTATVTAGSLVVSPGGYQATTAITTSGNYTFKILVWAPASNHILYVIADAAFAGTVDNISVREIPGAHLIQPTATSRPTLSSRYNQIVCSTGAATFWQQYNGSVITPNYSTGPDGVEPAARILTGSGSMGTVRIPTSGITLSLGKTYRAAVAIKSNTASSYDLALQIGDTIVVNAHVTPEWTVFSGSGGPAGEAYNFIDLELIPVNSDISVCQVSLVPASDASLPYQRVNTATDYDYDFSKFPPYLKFDGVDDSLYTAASIDFTSTDKMTVFAGVHKASDAAAGILVESSSAPNSTAGTFTVQAPVGAGLASFGIWSAGTTQRGAQVSDVTYAAPSTRVLTGVGDISGDLVVLRLNGEQFASAATDQGTGNYGNHVLYVGMRNNAILPFNGRIYQLAIKGKALSAAEIATVESFVNSKTKAY